MKFKRAEMNGAQGMVWVVVILAAVYLFAQYQTPGAGVPSTEAPIGSVTPGKIPCPYAPTVGLTAQDKYDSSVDVDSGTWKYILNAGGATTDADGSFEVTKGDVLKVLVADTNSSTHYRALWEVPIAKCGLNSLLYRDVVKFTTYEGKCYNDEGDPMNDTSYSANLTIGQGGSRSVKCELTGVADTGVPYGGVMIAEFNQSTYDEGKMDFQWDGVVLAEATTPDAYTVGIAGGTTKAWKIPAFEDVGTHTSFLDLQAESTVNPGPNDISTTTNYGDGVVLRLYPINCFEEEDVTPSEFKCAVEDEDNTFTSPGGTSKTSGQIMTIIIPVD
ncbi:MAG: hypothetical protein KKB31_03515 [Nanoarchaeota archaeon]|nr:hypothetical protein [Nanoarchaeota archaeon]